MKSISIFGLGYVGSVAAGCLAARGNRVIGVDIHPEKVRRLNAGEPPVYEPGLELLVRDAVSAGRLSAIRDPCSAVGETNISIVCVGTPCGGDGAIELRYVEEVVAQIADALEKKNEGGHWVIFRSTMLPGSTRRLAEKIRKFLTDPSRVKIAFFPEFLRQGTAVADYDDPSLSVVGVYGESGCDISELYGIVEPGTRVLDLESAELVKYACNAFHATKVGFANEIGRIGKRLSIDTGSVMEALCSDVRLNISKYYLRPGNPFGGSCLPKDVSALGALAREIGVAVPLLESLLPSNAKHIGHLRELVRVRPEREVVVLGLTFKPETDDLRGSALLQLVADLLSDGYHVRVYDPLLEVDKMVGVVKALVEDVLPQLPDLLCRDVGEALGEGGVVLASNRSAPLQDIAASVTRGHHFIDVTGWRELEEIALSYEGICW